MDVASKAGLRQRIEYLGRHRLIITVIALISNEINPSH